MTDYRNPRKTCFDGDSNYVLAFHIKVEWDAPHGYVIHLAEALEKGNGLLPNVRALMVALMQYGQAILRAEKTQAVVSAFKLCCRSTKSVQAAQIIVTALHPDQILSSQLWPH